MSKSKKGTYNAEDFAHVTADMVQRAESVVQDRARNRYSVSAIYKTHNEIFKLKERAQTCDTCLVIRATNLANWLKLRAGQPVEDDAPADDEVPQSLAPSLKSINEKYVFVLLSDQTPESELAMYAKALDTGIPAMDPAEVEVVKARVHDLNADIEALKPAPQFDDPNAPGYVAPAEGAKRIILQKVNKDTYVAEGEALYADYTATEEGKGTVTNSTTGKALAPGTYATEVEGKLLGVQPGGKAVYKDVPAA